MAAEKFLPTQAKADYIIQPAKEAVGQEEGDFSRKNLTKDSVFSFFIREHSGNAETRQRKRKLKLYIYATNH